MFCDCINNLCMKFNKRIISYFKKEKVILREDESFILIDRV